MMRKFVAILVFLLPSFLCIWILRFLDYKIGKHCRIGFSWINIKNLEMGDNSQIGHFNIIIVPDLIVGSSCVIKRFNIIKGNFSLRLKNVCVINQFNKITSSLNGKLTYCILNEYAIIGVGHTIDLTSHFTLGEYSILAGKGTQVWTHGFYHSKKTYNRWRIDGFVEIGRNVYIGSRCIICAGVTICDHCMLGAGVVVTKNITQEGLYVNQRLRCIEFDPDEAIKRYRKVDDYIYEK